MELAKYNNKELREAIKSLSVVQGTAKESGNPYYALEITLNNGFKARLFLKSAEIFAWTNAFEQLDIEQKIDNNEPIM